MTSRFTGPTVFLDNHMDFLYVHLMCSPDKEETMAAKYTFEQVMLQYGV